MKKNLLIPFLGLFIATLFSTPTLAAPIKGKVVSVTGSTVVVNCGKKAKKLLPGTPVTITIKKKDGGGC